MSHPLAFWIWFHVIILFFLTLDLAVFHRRAREETLKSALGWSSFWIALSLGFNAFLYMARGAEEALLFFTGYVIEKSLSIDNIFVFLVIFSFFRIEKSAQRKILYWGILGAFVLRISLILLGIYLLEQYHFVYYVLGVFLCYTAAKMAFQGEKQLELEKNWAYKICKKLFPITSTKSSHFFIKERGRTYATSLFVALLLIEGADVIFALDSIPAILAITTDPFIVYTSNVFAILGLRSLYFVLAHFQKKFQYFNIGLSVILFFIGAKMLLSTTIQISTAFSLSFICVALLLTVGISCFVKPKKL